MSTVATAASPGRVEDLPATDAGVSGYVSDYFATLKTLLDATNVSQIEQIVSLLFETFQTGKRLVLCGNGGSGSTTSHLVCDLAKNIFMDSGKVFEVIALTDSPAMITAWANDTDFTNIFAGQARTWLREGDVLIALSGSGNSANVLKAVEVANEVGAFSIGFCGYGGGKLADFAKMSIVVDRRNMQQVEDLHMIFGHVIFSALRDRIKGLIA